MIIYIEIQKKKIIKGTQECDVLYVVKGRKLTDIRLRQKKIQYIRTKFSYRLPTIPVVEKYMSVRVWKELLEY